MAATQHAQLLCRGLDLGWALMNPQWLRSLQLLMSSSTQRRTNLVTSLRSLKTPAGRGGASAAGDRCTWMPARQCAVLNML